MLYLVQTVSWIFRRDMTMGQGENGSFSHQGSLAMDISVPGVLHIPYYAPCDVVCVLVDRANALYAWESQAAVKWIDGTEDFISFYCIHDNSSSASSIVLGKKLNKGELMGHTGWGGNVPAGQAGDHLHLETAKGKYAGGLTNSQGTFMIQNQVHNYNVYPLTDPSGKNYTVTPQAGVPSYPWKTGNADGGSGGDNGGGGDNGSGGSGKPTIDLLKVNRFMYPEPSRKFVQLSAESIDDSYPKYHLIRTVFNRQLEKSHPDLIKYINSLQGDYGLEKLCCSPITTVTLTNGKGIQKNFNLADFKNQEEEFPVYVKGFLGKSNQVEFYFGDYLNLTEFPLHGSSSALPEAIIRKDALMDQTPKNFDLYIDTEKSYEYLNYNTIKQSMDNASFTLSQNQLQAANAERNFKLEQDKQTQLNQIAQTGARKGLDITQGGAWQQFGISQVQRNIGGAIGVGANLLSGNILGAGLGAASIGFNVGMDAMGLNAAQNTQNQALANSHATANQALAASQGAGEQIFMNSLATSQLIATNNYENTIANINAGLADLKNQPDISAISGADYNFEMAYDNDDIHCVIYTTNPQALHTLATFYAMYGYSIKRYDDISKYMKVRRSFNYVKTQGANVKGRVSNKWRNNLNMIFDSGITFWRDTDKMEKGDITENYAT